MRNCLKAFGLVLLATMIGTDAHAVMYQFDYLTPLTKGEEPYTPFLLMVVADDLWWANDTISGSQSWHGESPSPPGPDYHFYIGHPYEGLELILPGFDYVNVPCREDLGPEYVGSCSVSPSWLTYSAGLDFNLTFRDNFVLGSISFQGVFDSLWASSDARGIWSFGGFGTDYDGYYCGGDCTATGRWISGESHPVSQAPEPGTLGLFGICVFGLGMMRRKVA